MIDSFGRGNVLRSIAIEELVKGKSTVPITEPNPNYFNSNEYFPNVKSYLVDG